MTCDEQTCSQNIFKKSCSISVFRVVSGLGMYIRKVRNNFKISQKHIPLRLTNSSAVPSQMM